MSQKNKSKISHWLDYEEHPILSSFVILVASPVVVPYVLFLLMKEV